jgi:lipid A 4'-phosphatase
MREPGRGATVYWGVFAAVTLLYLVYPRIDLLLSGLFYEPGRGWYMAGEPWAHSLAVYVVPAAAWVLGLAFAGALAWAWLGPAASPRRRRVTGYLAAAYVLGPGLVTNLLLKDHWGRARPFRVLEFGGDRLFTSPLLPAHQCPTNCSFVSGDVSVPICLMAVAFLITDRRRRRWAMIAVTLLGGGVGFERIVQGKHFLSDVIYSVLLNTGLAWILYALIVERGAKGGAVPPDDPAP